MSPSQQRQRQFEEAVTSHLGGRSARITKNFGFSNSARVVEGGLFACTSNLATHSKKLANGSAGKTEPYVFLCVLTFPPQNEVYFAIVVDREADKVNRGLEKLYREGVKRNSQLVASGEKPGSISNNVKFYVTSDGHIYFHNYDFRDSLIPQPGEPALDRDCMAQIDSIQFSIWPPSASAQRGLLARDFVGYLGTLIGRSKVHEIPVWTSETAFHESMCRMPIDIPVSEIEQAVEKLGGFYPHGQVRRFHGAMNFLSHKHFVILSGLSGTGKTQLAIKYARAVHGLANEEPDPLLFICPVRPEWTDPTGLIGYYDLLTDRYIVPTFLSAILVATAHPNSPVFVVLDELNLARVEYYLSDVLSCIETGSPLQLHSNNVPLEGTTGTPIRAEIPIPKNLFVVGTINIDETTNPISDKVLDRASVIEMSTVDLDGFLVQLEGRESELGTAVKQARSVLMPVHELLQQHGLGFGYRLIEEFVRYHAFCDDKLPSDPHEVTDHLLVQKVLVKLRGTDRQRALLAGLEQIVSDLPLSRACIQHLQNDLDEFGSFQAMR